MADVTQTLGRTSGNDGRVKLHAASPVILAGISSWRRESGVGEIPLAHFEMPVDSGTGVPYPDALKGMGNLHKVMLEGIYNLNAGDATETGTTGITNGSTVALDLMHSKALGKGYPNVLGFVSNFVSGSKVGNEYAMFSCTVTVPGVFPAWGTVT